MQNNDPHSTDIEKLVLSCMINKPVLIDQAGGSLEKAKDDSVNVFFHHSHQVIYTQLTEMRRNEMPISLEFLCDYLTKKKQLQNANGLAYVAEVSNHAPTTAAFDDYLRSHKEYLLFRRLITLNRETANSCKEQSESFAGILELHSARLANISSSFISKKGSLLYDVVGVDKIKANEGDEDNADDSLLNKVLQLKDGHSPNVVSSGFSVLDDNYKPFQAGQMIVLGARPSVGKSSIGLNIAYQAAKVLRGGNSPKGLVAFFSLEMPKVSLAQRILSFHQRVTDEDISNKKTQGTGSMSALLQGMQEIQDLPILLDDTTQLTGLELKTKVRRYHDEYKEKYGGIKLVVVDYLQLMKSDRIDRNTSREREVAQLSWTIKTLAMEMNIPILVLAQLNRASEGRGVVRPRMDQLRESGAIEQDADVVLLLHRCQEKKKGGGADDDFDNKDDYVSTAGGGLKYELIVAKNRNGKTGRVYLDYRPSHTLFLPLDTRAPGTKNF